MAKLDTNHLRVDRIFPTNLSNVGGQGPGGLFFTETGTAGQGEGVNCGGIVQVVWGRFDSATSASIPGNTGGTRIGPSLGWQVEITPKSRLNRILIYCQWSGEISTPWSMVCGLTRRDVNQGTYTTIGPQSGDGNRLSGISVPKISYAQAAGNNASTPESFTLWFVDSPGNSFRAPGPLQYMPWIATNANRTMYIGRTQGDSNTRGHERMINTMMAWEISS